MAKKTVTEAAIREKAYEMWTADGQPHGQDQEYWYRAEAELKKPARRAPAKKPAAKATGAAKPAAAKKPAARKPAAKKPAAKAAAPKAPK